jgi:putative ABC transport system permease protein
MPLGEGLRLAIQAILDHKLRSFFTLLGVIVSVAFLVAVVAIIQGMNAYVRENLAGRRRRVAGLRATADHRRARR